MRLYQQRALDEIRKYYASGVKKVLLKMPTGSGKTWVFCEILKGVAEKDKHALMIVKGRKLVQQASHRLDREGVDHGILMSDHWRRRPGAKIQVASVDTVYARRLVPPADIIVIDESHQATSDGYRWLSSQYPDAFFLAVTATPYCKKSLRHVADAIICPISMKELISQNYLVPPVYYAPSIPDLTGVRVTNGDYAVEELDDILNQNSPIGDIVSSYKRLGENRPALLFAVSLAHSASIVAAFNAAGIPAIAVDADNSDEEREEAIRKLEAGEIRVICNVGIFCTGVDIPMVSCLIMARPTQSYTLYVQQAGRGTRIFPGKKDFILLDCSGNVLRHGLITEEREGSLDPIKTKNNVVSGLKTCKVCYAIFSDTNTCPCCNTVQTPQERVIETIEAVLTEVDEFHLRVVSRRGELRDIAKRRGYKKAWVYYQLCAEFGLDVAEKYQPKRIVPPWVQRRAQ